MRVAGDYELLEELGRGAMGVVFRARHVGDGHLAAVKVLLRPQDPLQARRFDREGEALARLRHPNVVRILAAGVTGGFPYLAMQLVEGRQLAELMEEGPLPVRLAVEIAQGVALGLAHAHELGILHRDVKPDNIIVSAEGAPLLADFGLVRDTDLERSRLTQTGAMLGTPVYMSPEQATGESARVTPAADVYSLGVVLYEMLAGERPYDADSHVELITRITSQVPPSVSRFNRDVGDRLAQAVARALAKDPGDRFPSALAFADELEASLYDAGARGRPVSLPLALGVGVSAALVLLALGAVFTKGERPDGAPSPDVSVVPSDAAPTGPDARTGEEQRLRAEVAEALARAERAPLSENPATLRSALSLLTRARSKHTDGALAAWVRVQRARVAERLGRSAEALDDYQAARRLDRTGATGAEALYREFRLLAEEDREDEAEALLKASAPLDAPPWTDLLVVFRLSWGKVAGQAGEALREAVRVREEHPRLSEAWSAEGTMLLIQGRGQDALASMQRAASLSPRDPRLRVNVAFARRALGDLAGAEGDARGALSISPDFVEALDLLGRLLSQRGEIEEGARQLERVVGLRPERNETRLDLVSLLYRNLRDVDRAEAHLRALEAGRFPASEVYLWLSGAHLLREDTPAALETLRLGLRVLERGPGFDKLAERLEQVAIHTGYQEVLREHSEELLASDPDDAIGLRMLGTAAAAEGKFEECQRVLERCVEVHPRDARARESLLEILEALGQLERVRRELPELLALGAGHAMLYAVQFLVGLGLDRNAIREQAASAARTFSQDGHAWLALANAEHFVGDYPAALRAAERAEELLLDDPSVLRCKGQVLLALGRKEEALEALDHGSWCDPTSSASLEVLAGHLLQSGQEARAVNHIRAYARLRKPGTTLGQQLELLYLYGLKVLGEREEALVVAEAMKGREYRAEGLLVLGRCLRDLGMLAEARRRAGELLRLRPDDADAIALERELRER